jgi:hypothetical protein
LRRNTSSPLQVGASRLATSLGEGLGRDPHAGDLYVFRVKRGDLVKIIWHDGVGLSLYAKRLDRGKFIWPAPRDGAVAISAATCWTAWIGATRAGLGARERRDKGSPRWTRVNHCDSLASWHWANRSCRMMLPL